MLEPGRDRANPIRGPDHRGHLDHPVGRATQRRTAPHRSPAWAARTLRGADGDATPSQLPDLAAAPDDLEQHPQPAREHHPHDPQLLAVPGPGFVTTGTSARAAPAGAAGSNRCPQRGHVTTNATGRSVGAVMT